jgi:uracil-DNA glycosylase family 4
MKLIILEGADNVGKSTAAEAIKAAYPEFAIKHFAAPKTLQEAKEEYLAFINHALETDNNYILDRSWIGEFVYAPILRGYEPDYRNELNKLLAGKNILSILITASQPTIESFGITTDYNKHMLEMNQYVEKRFIEAFNAISYGKKLIINQDNLASKEAFLSRTMEVVKGWLNNDYVFFPLCNDYSQTYFNLTNIKLSDCPYTNECPIHTNHKQYDFFKETGTITWGQGKEDASIMFIGEAPGHKGCGKLGIPFYNDKSGMFFRQLLFDNCLLETEIYITNVVKCTPNNNNIKQYETSTGENFITICSLHNLLAEIHKVNPKVIITLGSTARTAINNIIKYTHAKLLHIKHPAVIFYGENIDDYKLNFKKIIEEARLNG